MEGNKAKLKELYTSIKRSENIILYYSSKLFKLLDKISNSESEEEIAEFFIEFRAYVKIFKENLDTLSNLKESYCNLINSEKVSPTFKPTKLDKHIRRLDKLDKSIVEYFQRYYEFREILNEYEKEEA